MAVYKIRKLQRSETNIRSCSKSQQNNNAVKTIYIDNCCQWRFKLQEVFGITCQVKLDIFHAIQRIVQKIPKKHPFHSQCAADLRQVFRHDGDHGIKRTRSTPCSAKMLANLNSFVHRWENIVYDSNHVLSIAALHEIEKLKVHIKKAALMIFQLVVAPIEMKHSIDISELFFIEVGSQFL